MRAERVALVCRRRRDRWRRGSHLHGGRLHVHWLWDWLHVNRGYRHGRWHHRHRRYDDRWPVVRTVIGPVDRQTDADPDGNSGMSHAPRHYYCSQSSERELAKHRLTSSPRQWDKISWAVSPWRAWFLVTV